MTIAVLAIAAVASHSRDAGDAVREHMDTQAQTPAATVYFPSQYRLNAGDPEPHIEAF